CAGRSASTAPAGGTIGLVATPLPRPSMSRFGARSKIWEPGRMVN
ncbi:MAG: hypothetical protein AVDCRST_MAG67-2658, partial [uncultured Solirubrobacteraceae bacterium]